MPGEKTGGAGVKPSLCLENITFPALQSVITKLEEAKINEQDNE